MSEPMTIPYTPTEKRAALDDAIRSLKAEIAPYENKNRREPWWGGAKLYNSVIEHINIDIAVLQSMLKELPNAPD